MCIRDRFKSSSAREIDLLRFAFKCLQTHYKMQSVVCLNISVSAAFCAALFLIFYLFLFSIVQDSLGYGFIPAFRQAGSKQKSDRAVLFHRLVFTSVLGLRHFRNTGRYITIVTGLLLMQISGLTDQMQHILLAFMLLNVHGGEMAY